MSVNDKINAAIRHREESQRKSVMESALFHRAESTLHGVLLDRAKRGFDYTTVQIDCDTTESLTCTEQDLMWDIIRNRTGMDVRTRDANWLYAHTRIAGDKVLPLQAAPRMTFGFDAKK
jgi:hypothetical protein